MRKLAIVITVLIIWCSVANGGGRELNTGHWPSNTAPVALVDPDGNYAGISNIIGNFGLFTVAIDFPHYKIHKGDHYVAQKSATLGSGAKIQILINTPAAPTRLHFITPHTSSGESFFEIWKDTTVSNLGIPMTIYNRDNSLSDGSGVAIYNAPTIINAGDNQEGFGGHLGAGQTKGGESFGQNEIILDTDTLYLINTVSEAASNHVTVITDFYIVGGN